jgi:hypothetical protein
MICKMIAEEFHTFMQCHQKNVLAKLQMQHKHFQDFT